MASKRVHRSSGVEIVHPRAAGIDIGSREHWVAVSPGLDATLFNLQFSREFRPGSFCTV